VGVPTQLFCAPVSPSCKFSGQAVDLDAQRHQERRIENGSERCDVEIVEADEHGGVDDVVLVDDRPGANVIERLFFVTASLEE
jgi:hypothetical protein